MSSIHAEPPPPIVTDPSGISYATGPALGKGGFAICHRAERCDNGKPTGDVLALKIVKTKMEPAKLAQKFVTELQIHSKLSHPNIVTFYRAFSFSTSTYVVLELCSNGSLADMLRKRRQLTLPEIRRFVIQICGAVKYLHCRHIVHRDLKTGNLFLDSKMNIKVGDFGLAALLVTEKDMAVQRRTTMCGTPNYLAPEILEKGKGHDEKVDLWAIGVIAYTLAVGKAPFHASTKEEIYRKLKSGTYTWPELSATTNQSADLRDLVSSLLVPEEQRLLPDQIVSQNFFKVAFVPTSIPVLAREKVPRWADVSIPPSEVLQRGYSETWFTLCKDTGVGEYASGKCFKLNGGRRIKSIVHDIALEAQLGKQPTMPIPNSVVYTSTISDISSVSQPGPAQGLKTATSSRDLKEIASNEVQLSRSRGSGTKASSDSGLMPPPATRTITRPERAVSVRKAARTISEEAAKANTGLTVSADGPVIPQPRVKTAETQKNVAEKLKGSTNLHKKPSQAPLVKPEPSAPEPKIKRTADASLARRPGSIRAKEAPTIAQDEKRLSNLDELKQQACTRRLPTVSKHESAGVVCASGQPAPVTMVSTSTNKDRMKTVPPKDEASDESHPSQVLQRLINFRNNLLSAMSNESRPHRPSSKQMPFITRWVDYSRKHGIGYVLADGTVGCIINASRRLRTPVTHVIVRNGQYWLSQIGESFDYVDRIPLEVYEDCGAQGFGRRSIPDGDGAGKGLVDLDVERQRTLGVLWVKFGRYMCQSLDGDERYNPSGPKNFVRFYQRVGTVSMWVFADGSLQVHFPDHTKLVISADGIRISATCLSPEAAAYVDRHFSLLQHHISGRETFEDDLSTFLHDSGRLRARYVKANAIRDKLTFISEVIGHWIRNGGLGCMDGDYKTAGTSPLVQWTGLYCKELLERADRVTIGRYGGDNR